MTERNRIRELDQDELSDNEDDILRKKHTNETNDASVNSQITTEECITSDKIQIHEYLDDIIFYGNIHREEDTSEMLGSFVDTEKILNEIKPDNTASEADTETDRALDILHLQPPRQRADDPRRGGKTRKYGIQNR